MPCRGIIMKGSLTPAEWKVIEIIYMVILVHFSHINFHYLFYYRMSYQPPTREIYSKCHTIWRCDGWRHGESESGNRNRFIYDIDNIRRKEKSSTMYNWKSPLFFLLLHYQHNVIYSQQSNNFLLCYFFTKFITMKTPGIR